LEIQSDTGRFQTQERLSLLGSFHLLRDAFFGLHLKRLGLEKHVLAKALEDSVSVECPMVCVKDDVSCHLSNDKVFVPFLCELTHSQNLLANWQTLKQLLINCIGRVTLLSMHLSRAIESIAIRNRVLYRRVSMSSKSNPHQSISYFEVEVQKDAKRP
jgi:hypothetical protein